MKRIVMTCLICVLMSVSIASAQVDQYMEMLRTDVRAEKVAVITEVMEFTAEEGELFWPIYREYELELAALFDQRLANIKDYAENIDAIDEEKADKLISTAFKLQEKRQKLNKSYYKKFKKVLPVGKAARFFQAENKIETLVNAQLALEIPMIETK